MKTKNCIRTLFASSAVSCSLFLGAAQIHPDGTIYKVDVDKGDEYTLSDADLVALKSGTYVVLQKLGGGDLCVSGLTGFSGTLDVAEGVAILRASSIGGALIGFGATLVLDDDDQIADNGRLFINGDFDLHGHTEKVGLLTDPNASGYDTFRNERPGRIINNSEQASCLQASGWYFGKVEETVGKITFEILSGGICSPAGGIAPSDFQFNTKTETLLSFSQMQRYTFKFLALRDATADQMEIREIQLTYDGVPIPQSEYQYALVSYEQDGRKISSQRGDITDGSSMTGWTTAKGASNIIVTIELRGRSRINGYRICGGAYALQPGSWEVWGSRLNDIGSTLVDRRDGEEITEPSAYFAGNCSSNYLFSTILAHGSPLADETDFTLGSGATLRVMSNEPFRFGTLYGGGVVRLDYASVFAPGNLNQFEGSFAVNSEPSAAGNCTIRLDGSRGPSEQAVRNVKVESGNLTIENGCEDDVAVLVDDTHYAEGEHLFGRLADGRGRLGLVKRGSGTRTIETQDAKNTGMTKVEEGTLRLLAPTRFPSVRARYLRMRPTANNGGTDRYNYNWAIGEFRIFNADGQRVAWPSGTTVTAENGMNTTGNEVIDDNLDNRTLVANNKDGACSWLQIDTVTGVTFSGYDWYFYNQAGADQSRLAISWEILISDDASNWSVVSSAMNDTALPAVTNPAVGVRRSADGGVPYALGVPSQREGDSLYSPVPPEFFAGANRTSTRAPALKARYFRFAPHETYQKYGNQYNFGWHMNEFSLLRNGVRHLWSSSATVKLFGCNETRSDTSGREKLVDNIVGAAPGGVENRAMFDGLPSYIDIDAGEEVEFDAYGYTGCKNYWARLPAAWKFYVSSDGVDWHLADSQADVRDGLDVQTEYGNQGPWSIADRYPLLSAGPGNAIGDESPVEIAAGAKLEIVEDYEKFGPLSGSGELVQSMGIVEIGTLAKQPATFSGALSAKELIVSGTGIETFDGVDLSNVGKVTFAGGTLAGSVTAGNLVLSFEGGAFGGTVTSADSVSVAGSPKISVPAELGKSYRRTIIENATIDSASAAALENAEVVSDGSLRGYDVVVTVTDDSAVVTARKRGFVLSVR